MGKISSLTLLTDFGLTDIYVGVMKGVIAGIHPGARVIDLSHGVPRQNVTVAAFVLNAAVRYFSPDTLHVIVVDPGVGSGRRILYVETDKGHFLAPDNGVLGPVLEGAEIRTMIDVRERRFMLPETSNTFHGRDIFSPVAAHLSAGVAATELGPACQDPLGLSLKAFEPASGEASILFVDIFGNCCTNIPAALAPKVLEMRVGDERIKGPVVTSYAAREKGAELLIVNSFGFVELALNHGDAAARFGLTEGAQVAVRLDGQASRSKSSE